MSDSRSAYAASFDRYARIAQRLLDVPIALVTRIEPDRAIFQGAMGLPVEVDATREVPLSHSLCKHVVSSKAPLIVSDARLDPRVRDNLAVRDMGVVAYAGWPLTDHRNVVIGSLCAIDMVSRDWTSEDLNWLQEVAESCSSEIVQRELRLVTVQREQSARRAAQRNRMLLALSQSLAATRTVVSVAEAVMRVSQEELGCLRAGMWLRSPKEVVGWGDESSRARSSELLTYPAPPGVRWGSADRFRELPADDSNPMGMVLRLGEPKCYLTRAEVVAAFPEMASPGQNGETGWLLPLAVEGHDFGVLVLSWEQVHEASDGEKLAMQSLASYVAQAVQRAMLLQEREQVAVTLQNALLTRLPTVEGIALTARYLPSGSRDRVGGDWYDVLTLHSGATGLVVGDVVGHDMAAAAVMGQLRSMMRSLAWLHDADPWLALWSLDRAMRDLGVDTIASALYAVLDPPATPGGPSTLHWSSAGHPPPILLPPDGAARVLAGRSPDPLLGVEPDRVRSGDSAELAPGSTVLLYTDGLLERREEDITVGLDRLVAAVEQHRDLPLDDLTDSVIRDQVGDRPDDDVALLVVRIGG